MLDFFSMLGNYEQRKVARYDGPNGQMVSTVAVSDSDYPYETAVAHPDYNKGEIIIVENYHDKESAKIGHLKWESLVKRNELPKTLKSVGGSSIERLCKELGSKMVYKKKITNDKHRKRRIP